MLTQPIPAGHNNATDYSVYLRQMARTEEICEEAGLSAGTFSIERRTTTKALADFFRTFVLA